MRTRKTSGSASFASGTRGTFFDRISPSFYTLSNRSEQQNSELIEGQEKLSWWSGQELDPYNCEKYYSGKIPHEFIGCECGYKFFPLKTPLFKQDTFYSSSFIYNFKLFLNLDRIKFRDVI